jgi:hypothetical protein
MSFRPRKAHRCVSLAGLCLGGALACAAGLAGCIGSGDDNTLRAFPVGDAHAGDATSDGPTDAHPGDGSIEATGDAALDAGDAAVQEAGEAGPAFPHVSFSSTSIDFGLVGCGSTPPASKTLTVTNDGDGTLALSASLVGTAFAVSPTSLMLPHGMSGTLTVTATVPGSSTAGTALSGSLAIFTNDPVNPNRILPLSATPNGATLTGTSLYAFPTSEVGTPAPPVVVQLRNTGNASASFAVGAPSNPSITIAGPGGGGVLLKPGDAWSGVASFTPATSIPVTATSMVTATGGLCGSSLTSISFQAQGSTGRIVGWPGNSTIDFGPALCGGTAPPPQKITITNASPTTDAHLTTVKTFNANGFATDATAGIKITAGGSLTITFTAPAVPPRSALTPLSGTIVFQTDADPSPVTITLTEEPQGAVLAFDTSATTNFGSFGTVILLQSKAQNFSVTNAGNVPANVTVAGTENAGADGGVGASADAGGDATVDATIDSGAPAPFSVSTPTFTIGAAPGASTPSTQPDSVTFQPVHANATIGNLALRVDPATALCGPLPAPLPLSGNAIGGGPVVAPTSLTFSPTCGGAAPPAQVFVVANSGTVDLTWTMSSITGPSANLYNAVASPLPGLLIPGASATVTVTVAKVPSPAPTLNLAQLAAQVTINTDVPFDPPHVVTLSEAPLGDQLSVSVGSLRFGQVPVNTSIGQNFAITNNANPGSADAKLALSVISGLDSGLTAYSVPASASIAAGASASEAVTFNATTPGAYPATLAFKTADALCTPLPTPIVLSGTGTGGALALSSTTLAFGTDAQDAKGLVDCGTTGNPRTLTLSNVGNQTFNVLTVTLGKGSSSPFTLSGPATTLPAAFAIGGSSTLTITPAALPAMVANPNDALAFSDVLTITTDAPADTPHKVKLVMQPRGAVIASTPVQTAWTFGTIGAGSIGTFTSTIQNTGNASATVTLKGLSLPEVFGMQNNPTTVKPNNVAALVGQFTPPSQNGTWVDQGQLVVDSSSFCEPLPSQWNAPNINLSGSSNANPVVTVSGNPVFATADCGSAPPGGQGVKITNSTNQAYAYTAKLSSGTWYTITDASAGTLAANGSATIVVNPKTVTPGPGVLPGSAPYGDDLLINVFSPSDAGTSDAGTSVMSFTVPISWTLNGAVLSLVDGSGPNAQGFYVADSTSGFALRIDNGGTASANVDFAIQPSGAFTIQPTPPIQVIPNVRALPQLVSTTMSATCPSTTNGTATFVYSGPVCQPFTLSSINVHSCAGTF